MTEYSAVIFVFLFFLLAEYASHLDNEWIVEEFCWPERLNLVQLNVELGSRKSKRQLAQFPALIKIEDVLLRDIISGDRAHNTEFRLHIKPTNIVLIFETAKVESRLGQLADTKLGQIRSWDREALVSSSDRNSPSPFHYCYSKLDVVESYKGRPVGRSRACKECFYTRNSKGLANCSRLPP